MFLAKKNNKRKSITNKWGIKKAKQKILREEREQRTIRKKLKCKGASQGKRTSAVELAKQKIKTDLTQDNIRLLNKMKQITKLDGKLVEKLFVEKKKPEKETKEETTKSIFTDDDFAKFVQSYD